MKKIGIDALLGSSLERLLRVEQDEVPEQNPNDKPCMKENLLQECLVRIVDPCY